MKQNLEKFKLVSKETAQEGIVKLENMSDQMSNARCRAVFWMVVLNSVLWIIMGPVVLGHAAVNCIEECDVKLSIGLLFTIGGACILIPASFVGYTYFKRKFHYSRLQYSINPHIACCCSSEPEPDDENWSWSSKAAPSEEENRFTA
jgi:hypothetical protein